MRERRPLADPRLGAAPWVAEGEARSALPVLQARFQDEGMVGVIAAGFAGPGLEAAWTVAGGFADLDGGKPLTARQAMLAGSVTKLLTATTVLRLVAEGLVGLDDEANRHLSTLKLRADTVTVRHLLTHTAGVPSDFEHFVDEVCPAPALLGAEVDIEFPPGSQHRYSNGGYAVLGELIAHVRGQPCWEALEADVLGPLAMDDSRILLCWPPGAPRGYAVRDGAAVATDPKVPSVPAAGGLYATAADLGRFLAGWRSLLPEDLAAAATSAQVGIGEGRSQGYGWRIGTGPDGQPVAGHAGGVLGFRASLLWAPGRNRASVVLVNSESAHAEGINAEVLALG